MENEKTNKPLQILELFGGIGSPRVALRNMGIPVKAIDYVEIDEKAVRSYNAMFASELEYKTQNVRGWNLKPDILIHGSPCQDVSIAGKRKGNDEGSGTRSSLMWETLKIIRNMGEWKPKVVIWENVKGVIHKQMKRNFDRYLSEMESMGYVNSYEVLNAMDFGLPQNRERVFTISILNGPAFDFSRLKHKQMEPIKLFLDETEEEQYLVTQPSMVKKIGQTSHQNFRGYLPIISDCANTITTAQMRCPNSGVIDLGNGKFRYLTEKECWKLQGFSDEDFLAALKANPGKAGCMNGALYKQAGNAMPVNVMQAIMEVLLPETNGGCHEHI